MAVPRDQECSAQCDGQRSQRATRVLDPVGRHRNARALAHLSEGGRLVPCFVVLRNRACTTRFQQGMTVCVVPVAFHTTNQRARHDNQCPAFVVAHTPLVYDFLLQFQRVGSSPPGETVSGQSVFGHRDVASQMGVGRGGAVEGGAPEGRGPGTLDHEEGPWWLTVICVVMS